MPDQNELLCTNSIVDLDAKLVPDTYDVNDGILASELNTVNDGCIPDDSKPPYDSGVKFEVANADTNLNKVFSNPGDRNTVYWALEHQYF